MFLTVLNKQYSSISTSKSGTNDLNIQLQIITIMLHLSNIIRQIPKTIQMKEKE